MKKYLLLPALAVTALMISGCSVSSQDGVVATEKRSGGFMGLATKDDIEVNSAKAFAGAKNVVIASFKVGFNESKNMNKQAGGSGFMSRGFGGRSTGLVKLEGITPDVMQKITDKAYDDFVKQLAAKGYTVMPRSTFTSHEAYQGTKEYDFPYKDDNSGLFSSYGVGTYYSPKAIGNKQPVFLGEIDGVTGGFGFSNPMNAVAKFGKETGTHVLNVTYFVDFAGASGSAGFTTSSISVGQVMSVDKGILGIGSGHQGTFSSGVGSLTLGQPIGSSIQFATVENKTSAAEVGLETSINIISALAGSGTNQTREFVFKANPARYTEAALDVLGRANTSLTNKMAELR